MMHTVVFYCQNLDKDLNNYENKLFLSRSTTFKVINVVYVIALITPYKIHQFWSKFNLISSKMGI